MGKKSKKEVEEKENVDGTVDQQRDYDDYEVAQEEAEEKSKPEPKPKVNKKTWQTI